MPQHPQDLDALLNTNKTTTDQAQYKASKPQNVLVPQLDQKNKIPAIQASSINTLSTM
ncbi:MAG TPA: hypothetical protein VJC06_00170 [Candidatus Paceibacterota bacterium]